MARSKRNLTAIIPAAAPGRRMKSYGPRPLIDVGGKTVIARQIEAVRAASPSAEVIVVLGHEADRVARCLPRDVKVVENERYAESNVARSIGMGLRAASNRRVLLLYGDLVFPAAAISEIARASRSSALVDSGGRIDASEVGVTVFGGRVTRFDFGLAAKWAQVALLEGPELERFRASACDPSNRMCFGWELLNAVVDAGGVLLAKCLGPHGLVEIDSSRDIARAARAVASPPGAIMI